MVESKCQICKKPIVFEYRAFCYKRCADIDLAHWFRGDYCIEGEAKPDEEDEKEEI